MKFTVEVFYYVFWINAIYLARNAAFLAAISTLAARTSTLSAAVPI
jgi:hypothetical protein